jgi:hypothetical protein
MPLVVVVAIVQQAEAVVQRGQVAQMRKVQQAEVVAQVEARVLTEAVEAAVQVEHVA